jgi:hypothetical protein
MHLPQPAQANPDKQLERSISGTQLAKIKIGGFLFALTTNQAHDQKGREV